jgi:RNA polymerase sigma factor (sigma-70 family)
VQSTFLNAFRGIKRGVVPELEAAWLFKIAENVCLTRRRSSWRRDRIESAADLDLVEAVTPAPGRLADELIGLQHVLEQMPESQRSAILLREWQGLSYREIAAELELSQSAVETLLFRARRSLAQGLETPPERSRRRAKARGADWGNVLAGLKSVLLGGSAAAKVAATVAVVSAGTVAATAPVQHYGALVHRPKVPAVSTTPAAATPRATVRHVAPAAPAPHVHLRPALHAHRAAPPRRTNVPAAAHHEAARPQPASVAVPAADHRPTDHGGGSTSGPGEDHGHGGGQGRRRGHVGWTPGSQSRGDHGGPGLGNVRADHSRGDSAGHADGGGHGGRAGHGH